MQQQSTTDFERNRECSLMIPYRLFVKSILVRSTSVTAIGSSKDAVVFRTCVAVISGDRTRRVDAHRGRSKKQTLEGQWW